MSWKLINEISERKSTPVGQLGEIQQKRLENWYKHFRGFLENPPVIENEDEEIPPILSNLNIMEDPFDEGECTNIRKSLVEGKSCGEDGITTEILKRCNLNNVVLDICNRDLIDGDKPKQWSILNIIPIHKSVDLSNEATIDLLINFFTSHLSARVIW